MTIIAVSIWLILLLATLGLLWSITIYLCTRPWIPMGIALFTIVLSTAGSAFIQGAYVLDFAFYIAELIR